MAEATGNKILDNMVKFIEQHGDEEVQRIEKSAKDQFTIQKNNYVSIEKDKVLESLRNDLSNQEVRMKIEKSKEQNEKRIMKMRKVNDYVDQLNVLCRDKVREDLASDQDAYRKLLKDLLLQGLIKLMEAKVKIRCREQDKDLIEGVLEEAVGEYK
jgi:V-type H+-transporting ATPase subunit E